MLITWCLRADAGLSSTLSFQIRILPLFSAAIWSRTGATMRHGPHHSAQKSTTIVTSDAGDLLLERAVGEDVNSLGHDLPPVRTWGRTSPCVLVKRRAGAVRFRTW